MKASIISIAALAALASAQPVNERGLPSWLNDVMNRWRPSTTTTTRTSTTTMTTTVTPTTSNPVVNDPTSTTSCDTSTTTTYLTTTSTITWQPSPTTTTTRTTTTTPPYVRTTRSSTTSAQPVSTGSGGSGSTGGGSSSDGGSYGQPILNQHNLHRNNHSAYPLAWDDELAAIAQSIGETCVYAHNTTAGGGGYGQNIGAGYLPDDVDGMVTNGMYNGEINAYPGYGSEPDMSNFHAWGHFSQIVWKSTQRVGCATVYCPNGLANTNSRVRPYFTVCNFKPPGNYGGQYAKNVGQPLGQASISC